jgi:hypothetical protein
MLTHSLVHTNADSIGVISATVPLPPKHFRRPDGVSGLTALLRKLEVGESVALPRRERENLYARAYRLKIRISIRLVDPTTIRVWRVV